MLDVCNRFVDYGRLTVPAAVVVLALDLEARGFSLTPAGHDLIVRPFSRLTDDDTAQIRRWKRHLLAMLAEEVPCLT